VGHPLTRCAERAIGGGAGALPYGAPVEIVGQVAMTRALYGRIVRAGLRKLFVRYRIIGALALAAGALSLAQGDNRALMTAALAAGVFAVLAPELTTFLGARKLQLGDGQVWAYRVSPAGAGQTSPVADVSVAWPSVERVDEVGVGWVLRLRAGGFLVLPRAAFDSTRLPVVAEMVRTRGPVPRP
jgi:hypothetical protein